MLYEVICGHGRIMWNCVCCSVWVSIRLSGALTRVGYSYSSAWLQVTVTSMRRTSFYSTTSHYSWWRNSSFHIHKSNIHTTTSSSLRALALQSWRLPTKPSCAHTAFLVFIVSWLMRKWTRSFLLISMGLGVLWWPLNVSVLCAPVHLLILQCANILWMFD